MDVWAPAVRDVVISAAPPEFELRFASSYDWADQVAVAAQADILLPGFAAVTANLLAHAPRVRLIQKWGVGIDAIDLDAVRRAGITLSITNGANAGPVAELAVALMLAVYRRIPYVNRTMREGSWPTPEMRETCYQINGKTVGLVGFGSIGRMLARRLRGFDAHVVYFDPHRAETLVEQELQARYAPLDEVMRTSDILSLHAPLLPQTAHMINAVSIRSMKNGAVLINTARGGLVDEQALFDALLNGKLRGAGLDAFDPEPPRAENPLLRLDQVVVTPHAGGGVFDNIGNVARHAFANMLNFVRGEPIRAADLVIAAPAGTGVGASHG